MRAFYLRIYKLLYLYYIRLLYLKSQLSKFYTYFFYNTLCILLIILSTHNATFELKTFLYTIFFSTFLYLVDRWKLGLFLSSIYFDWVRQKGLPIKGDAYSNMYVINESLSYNESIEILKDDAFFWVTLIKRNPSNPKNSELLNELEKRQEAIADLSQTKREGFTVLGTFFSNRRPFSFMFEQELAIASAVSITLLLNYILVFTWRLEYLSSDNQAFQIILALSILYVFFYFSIINIINKKFSLEYEGEYEVQFSERYPELKNLFLKYKGKTLKFNRLEVFKDFFRHYFRFFQFKAIMAFLFSSLYFLIFSLIYASLEYIIFDIIIGYQIVDFWFKFYSSLIIIWFASFIWFSSFIMTSLWKNIIINLIFLIILYGLFTYIFTDSLQLLKEKIQSSIAPLSLFGLFLSYIISATRKMFFDKDNSIIWKLS